MQITIEHLTSLFADTFHAAFSPSYYSMEDFQKSLVHWQALAMDVPLECNDLKLLRNRQAMALSYDLHFCSPSHFAGGARDRSFKTCNSDLTSLHIPVLSIHQSGLLQAIFQD